MKKLKALVCTLLLSAMLVGNVFASGASGTGIFNFLTDAVQSVLSMLESGGSCPLRQCTNCRPQDQRDENGNCRPRE